MKKVFYNTIFVLYAIIAVFVTICLLSYNDYKITEFGNSSFIIVSDNQLEPDFKKGDLVITNKKDKVEENSKMFFYNTYEKNVEVALGKVTKAEKTTNTETTYTIEGEHVLSSEYVLGPSKTAIRIPVVGTILGILESKWGFLFLIVFPSLLFFIYEIGVVVSEIRGTRKKEEKD